MLIVWRTLRNAWMDYSIWALSTARERPIWRIPLAYASFFGAGLLIGSIVLPLFALGAIWAESFLPFALPQTVWAALILAPLVFIIVGAVTLFGAAIFVFQFQIAQLWFLLVFRPLEHDTCAVRHLEKLQSLRSKPQAGSN